MWRKSCIYLIYNSNLFKQFNFNFFPESWLINDYTSSDLSLVKNESINYGDDNFETTNYIEQDHSLMSSIQCQTCGKCYNHKSSLYTHQKFYCGKEPQSRCPLCSYVTFQKKHMRSHMKNKHKDRAYNI